jgi:pimeloyl-ACP methyl ester carboxylesterase
MINEITDPKHPAARYIVPLNMNGLQGRMLQAPATKNHKREILLIYGHHAMLERWWGLVENLQEYGNVTMPDLPGFGGMDNFYKVGQHPTIDNFADYLAAFVRLRYKRRRVTIIGISFGFVVATRMLQRYPELAKKVDLLVSMVGFMHRDDFVFKPHNRKLMQLSSRFFATRPVSYLIRYVGLNGPVIRFIYAKLPAGKRRLSSMDPFEAREMLEYDVKLWQLNDVATHWLTTSYFLNIDNCIDKINLPVWHVASKNDPYFDVHLVEQHMLVVFNTCTIAEIDAKAHTPGLLGSKQEMGAMLPTRLRKILALQ